MLFGIMNFYSPDNGNFQGVVRNMINNKLTEKIVIKASLYPKNQDYATLIKEELPDVLIGFQFTNYLANEYGDDVLFNTTFVSLITRMNKGVNFSEVDNYYKNYSSFFKKINSYIDSHIDCKILLSDISDYVGLSESRLSHLFKEYLGISILQYIINKRLTIAKDMLKIGTSINDVCTKCGFQDYSSFLRTFKKKFNISPKAYQKQYYKQQ